MKKIIGAVIIVAATAFAACNGSGSGNVTVEPGLDSLFSSAKADSMVMSSAQMGGWELGGMIAQAKQSDSTFSETDFLNGVKYAMAADTSVSYTYGMQIGMNINNMIKNWDKNGIYVNRNAFFEAFKKSLMQKSDTVPNFEQSAFVNSLNQRLNQEFYQAKEAYENYKLENTDESKANVARGEQYIDSVAKANPSVKIAASGLAYDITNPGSDKKASLENDDIVDVWYTASTLDGRVFDRVDSINARPRPLKYFGTPGLQQGIEMVGEGGSAVLYVPGRLAYGPNKDGRYRLTPNEPIIYNIQVKQVQTPAEAAAAREAEKKNKK